MAFIDKKDKKILAELDFDARAAYSKIAKNTGTSKQLVKYRIEEMQRKGLMKNTFAAIDYFKLGYTCFHLFIKLKNVTKKKEEAIVQFVKDLKYSKHVYMMGGDWDLHLQIWVPDIRELAKIISKIHRRYGSNILKKQISIATRFTYFSHGYIHGHKSSSMSTYLHTKVHDISKKDMQLLKMLEKSGREPNTALSRRLDLSPETVRRKIRDFKKEGIIMAFRAEIDSSMLDFLHFKLFIKLRTKPIKRIEEFIRYLATIENVLYVSKSIEMSELEVNIFAKNYRIFYETVNQIKYTYPDIMENFYWNIGFIVN